MIIKRNRPGKVGKFFAIWPRWTPDGWVALEWLHWELIESWGWGSGAEYRYARFVPNKLYDQGVRRKFWGGKVYDECPYPENRCTAPDCTCQNERRRAAVCGERNTVEPCRYPRCTCMEIGGSTCPT